MLDLIVFTLVNVGLFAAFIVAMRFYWFVGPIAGVLGGIFTLEMYRQGPDLIIRVFLDSSNSLVYQTTPLGYFFYVPIVLSVLCIGAAAKYKK